MAVSNVVYPVDTTNKRKRNKISYCCYPSILNYSGIYCCVQGNCTLEYDLLAPKRKPKNSCSVTIDVKRKV